LPDTLVVPRNQVDALQNISNTQVVGFTESASVDPFQNIAARPQYPRHLAAAGVNMLARHRRQQSTLFLSCALVAVCKSIQCVAVLRIKEHEPRAAIRQRLQQRERVAALCRIPPIL
jgi:hypothetical protein